MKKDLKVLHCPTGIGGHPQELARAERAVGLLSHSVTFEQNYLNYPSDEILFKKTDPEYIRQLKRWTLLIRALFNYDVIHFNFGQTILPAPVPTHRLANHNYPGIIKSLYNLYAGFFELKDLIWLKKTGKIIAVTFQGDDARQGDYCLNNFNITHAKEVDPSYYTTETDTWKRKRIKLFNKYADIIYSLNPDLLHVLPERAQFIPYSNVDPHSIQFLNKNLNALPLVCHAPTNRQVKGTCYILDAVSKLKKEGVAFDFTLVEDMSNAEAKKIYSKADLLVDQLLAGWYGGVSVEAMAMGKPVICYIRESDLKFISKPMREDIPIINANPNTIYEVLKSYLTVRKQELLGIGERSRIYVEKWHDPLKIATIIKTDYEKALKKKF